MQWETRSGITNIRGLGVTSTEGEESFGGMTGMKDISQGQVLIARGEVSAKFRGGATSRRALSQMAWGLYTLSQRLGRMDPLQ